MSAGFKADQSHAWSEIKQLFSDSNLFAKPLETANGPGSTMATTENLRAWLPPVFERYEITSILDAACGDWSWFKNVSLDGISYLGWDVEPRIVAENQERFPEYTFERVNLLEAPAVPPVDLILCRHMLIHLPTGYAKEVVDKFKASGSKYLLTSNFPGADNNYVYNPEENAWRGYCERPLDLEAPPFSLRKRIDAFHETPGPHGVISLPHELALFQL